MNEWEKLDEHLHGPKEEIKPEGTNEWDKLDEHINDKTTEANTQHVLVTREENRIVLSKHGYTDAHIDYAEVFLNGVLMYDTRTFKNGDVITVRVYDQEEEEEEE